MNYDPKLISALEPTQLAEAKSRALPRRQLDRGTVGLLIALRVYVLIAVPLVCYAFIHALVTPQ